MHTLFKEKLESGTFQDFSITFQIILHHLEMGKMKLFGIKIWLQTLSYKITTVLNLIFYKLFGDFVFQTCFSV